MSLILTQSPEELLQLFQGLKLPEDVSAMLEVTHRDFNYWMYRTPEEKRYTTFYIGKKKGGERKIDTPTTNVKILQQKLNQVLQAVYSTKPSVHGFAKGKNVKSNGEQHVKKTWVLNVDLEDFSLPSTLGGCAECSWVSHTLCPRMYRLYSPISVASKATSLKVHRLLPLSAT